MKRQTCEPVHKKKNKKNNEIIILCRHSILYQHILSILKLLIDETIMHASPVKKTIYYFIHIDY